MQLHDYQRTAVAHLHQNPRAGLFLDMGLGKTAVTLSALTSDHLPALVVATKRVTEEVWPVEAALWRPDLRLALAVGSPRQRAVALADQQADITIISRDNMADAIPHAARWRTVVLDETSGFKTRGTNRWKNARKLVERGGQPVPHVWGLTGTPSPNGLLDLWAQMYLIDGGQRLGRTLTHYRRRYFYPGRQLASGVVTEWLLRPEAEQAIHRSLEDICVYMSDEGRLELPPMTYNTVQVQLPPEARRVYKEMKRDLVTTVDLLGGVFSAANAAVLANRLTQITAGFLYSDDHQLDPLAHPPTVLHQEKVRAVREIVDGTGSPVLVWYRYKQELAMLRAALPEASTIKDPDVVRRWNAGQVPVLLAHPASAGHGLNLQHGGHTAVWTSLPWSLEEWQQANKRLARQGQRHPVMVHLLLAPRTVDSDILRALEEKTTVQQALLDHLESVL